MKQSFSISPRILSHLGEDLIKNESIALLELVKNSYDACAKKCTVTFVAGTKGVKEIHIEDDGSGMSQDIIDRAYLTLGTDYKAKSLVQNECGRIPLGEKGIGRLGIHKLGNDITIVTKRDGSNEISLRIDWTQLTRIDKLHDFIIHTQENSKPEIFKKHSGTLIKIVDLKSKWTKRDLRQVYRDLMSLNSPFAENNDSFNVIVQGDDDVFSGLPDFEQIKSSALYSGKVKMAGDKITDFKYEFKPWKTLTKVDKGRIVKKDDLIKQDLQLSDDDDYIVDLDEYKIGEIVLDVLIYEMSSEIFNHVIGEKTSIKNYVRENGGIRVYRDGMRVYNYGEKDSDWLGIDRNRISRFAGAIGNNMIIGSVQLDRGQSMGLREKSNREGFIEGEAYDAFVAAVQYALSIIVRERNVDKIRLTTLYKQRKIVEPVISDLNEVIDYVDEKIDEPEKTEILKYLYRINSQYDEVKEILIKSANAGLNLSIVIHEVEKLIASLMGSIRENDIKTATRISGSLERIVKGYSAMIKKSDIRLAPLSEAVEVVMNNFEFRFSDHEISAWSNWKDCDLKAYYAETEVVSILTNLIDNSIFWLKYARQENRRLSIYITDEIEIDDVQYNSIIISDNGPGFNIPPDVAIKPFITGKPRNLGSGLGLHVSSEMAKSMNGKLEFLDPLDYALPRYITSHKIDKAMVALCLPIRKK